MDTEHVREIFFVDFIRAGENKGYDLNPEDISQVIDFLDEQVGGSWAIVGSMSLAVHVSGFRTLTPDDSQGVGRTAPPGVYCPRWRALAVACSGSS